MAAVPPIIEDRIRIDFPPPLRDADLDLADIEALRLVLYGGSVIDWHRLSFSDRDRVRRFLKTNGFDLDDRRDVARLGYLHQEAMDYLRRHFSFRFSRVVSSPESVEDLFLVASQRGRFNRNQLLACVVLKTMHVIQHLEARELLHEVAVSEASLFSALEKRLHQFGREVMAAGLPVVHFYGSRKSRDSMVTKLFSKKDSTAAAILDRLRFRIVTETRDDIVTVLAYLLRYVFPWNHVRAGQASNNLVQLRRFIEERDELRPLLDQIQADVGVEVPDGLDLENEFSGRTYQMINFILDVPLELDDVVGAEVLDRLEKRGRVVYVLVEFQIVDQECAYLNEQGENSHANYKRRQRQKVEDRLKWGQLREHLRRQRAAAKRAAGGPEEG